MEQLALEIPIKRAPINPVRDTQAYRLFGDSAVVPLNKVVAEEVVTHLAELEGLTDKRVAYG